MKTTLSTYDIAEALLNDSNANWSRAGALALAQYLEEWEESVGEEMELDVVGIRCDFSEWSSLQEWAEDYFINWKDDLRIDEDDDEDDIDEKIREYITNHGTLIEFDDGVIVASF